MNKRKLKLYYTSDIHGFFYPTTYGDNIEKNMGLFLCCAGFERDENTLYLDGGDILQGSAFTYFCKQKQNSNLPVAEIMNAAGCDFYTIGNHDFNYGISYLKEYIHNTKGRCVCQNLTDLKGNVLFPYQIKKMKNGLRVGITGIVTDYVNIWERPENLIGVQITSAFEAARDALQEMKQSCDVTICLYHGGFECDLETGEKLSESAENVGYRICRELDFDLLLTGHQHMHVEGRSLFDTFTVQPMEYGQEAYCVEMEEQGDKLQFQSKLIVPEVSKRSSKFDRMVQKADRINNAVEQWLDQSLGHLNRELLPMDRAQMAFGSSGIADFLNQIQLYYSKAQISAVGLANELSGFHADVKTRDIIATYPYPNTLVVLEISGARLKAAMERSAEYFAYTKEHKLTVAKSFLVPKVEHYNYDYFAGITYEIHPENEIGNRIQHICRNGKEIKPEETFSICINNYRATGAGNYPMYKDCPVLRIINVEMVELIMDYFSVFPFVEV